MRLISLPQFPILLHCCNLVERVCFVSYGIRGEKNNAANVWHANVILVVNLYMLNSEVVRLK